MKDKFIIDSNILIYALNKSAKEKHEKAKKLMLEAEKFDAAIPVRCLAETYFQVLKKDVSTEKARTFIEDLKHDRDFKIIQYGSKELDSAIETNINFWDRMIEETALSNDYKTIYTEKSSDFNKIEAVNPFKPRNGRK